MTGQEETNQIPDWHAGWPLLLRRYELQVQASQPELARAKNWIGATERTPAAPICVPGEAAHGRPKRELWASLTSFQNSAHIYVYIYV